MKSEPTPPTKEHDIEGKTSNKGIGTEFWRAVSNVAITMAAIGGLGFLLFPSESTKNLALGTIGLAATSGLCISIRSMMIVFDKVSKTSNDIGTELQK